MNAPLTLSEQLLARVIAYLEGLDMVVTRAASARALELVQEALCQQDEDPFAYVMDRLPLQFALPQLDLPPLGPPVNRGSIGYSK
jgi:hypothetical protein